MRYNYHCNKCGICYERESPVDRRDGYEAGLHEGCNYQAVRIFQPAEVCIPFSFRVNLRSLIPTYEECAEVDKRNEAYLRQPKEPAKPSFEECLETACVENRVNPNALNQYQMKHINMTELESRVSPNFAWGE